jgi:hypothetical protein
MVRKFELIRTPSERGNDMAKGMKKAKRKTAARKRGAKKRGTKRR